MITIDEVLSDENKALAFESFRKKRDGCGPDGMLVSELEGYWKANGALVERRIREGSWRPGIAKVFEASMHSGKQREISNVNVVDRFVERLLQQRLKDEFELGFLPNSMAYQEGKGMLEAAMLARDYVAAGNAFLCEVDIQDFFASINLGMLLGLCSPHLDECVDALVDVMLHREIERNGKISRNSRGLLQGSSMSPVLSNVFLHRLDQSMDELGLNWIRFSDNIYVYCKTSDEAAVRYEWLCAELQNTRQLGVNKQKSGVYKAQARRVLGYDLVPSGDAIELRKHQYTVRKSFPTWHESTVSKSHGEYHIVQDGIINRKDYSLLFENDEERHHIPVGVVDQLNIYGSVVVSPAALRTISREGIRLAYLDDFGDLIGTYVPESHGRAADVFLAQCQLYSDSTRRLGMRMACGRATVC